MKTFDEWDIDEVERTFGLEAAPNHELLHTWLTARHEILPEETFVIALLRDDLSMNANLWNEDELKFKFIAPFVSLERYNTPKFRVFTQRPLVATVISVHQEEITLGGRVDFIVATGKAKPIQPFFFLHEYKKEQASETDPRAQLLVEMLAVQVLPWRESTPAFGRWQYTRCSYAGWIPACPGMTEISTL
jgi:hypothetical protein